MKKKRKECIEYSIQKKKMKKKILLCSLFVMLIVTLVGCGKAKDNDLKISWYDGSTELRTDTIEKNSKVESWEPGKTGYYFSNWYSDSSLSNLFDFSKELTEDTNIYAKFNANELTISYYDDDKILSAQNALFGGKAKAWTPNKEGYTFKGWYLDQNLTKSFSFETPISSNLKLYASFSKNEEVIMQYSIDLNTDGKSFTYGYENNRQTVAITDHAILLDGSLSDEEASKLENVYNNFNDAIEAAKDGTQTEPMAIYIAPSVYWIHDKESKSTTEAFGIVKKCQNLHMVGLTEDARNVVIAANYGHNEGYDGGNWTMFSITGDGLTLKNMTFGNYCNVDLEYPLDKTLNYPKRTSNVTQGQIGSYNGDKLYAENVRFISRLNMMPFNNSGRALYYKCHMESTDDSLNGSSKSVYLECDFDFYSSKPWYSSSGSTLLNCKMNVVHMNSKSVINQYLSKAESRYTVIDSEFICENSNCKFGWTDVISSELRNYYSNVTFNGNKVKFDNGGANSSNSIDITGTEMLKGYKLIDSDGKVVYNTYNLLRGKDEWDPMGVKELALELNAADVATSMAGYTDVDVLETGNELSVATITYSLSGPQSTDYNALANVDFSIKDEDKAFVEITKSEDGKSCTAIGTNNEELPRTVIVEIIDKSGLTAAVELTIRPSILAAPEFTSTPVIVQKENGTAEVNYELALDGRDDMSRIIWSVSSNQDGSNPIQIAIGRGDTPLKSIKLTKAYVGMYLQISIERKHIRSDYAPSETYYSTEAIKEIGTYTITELHTDFSDIVVGAQTQIIPGFFTFDGNIPADTQPNYIPLDSTEVSTKYSAKVKNWTTTNNNAWNYGTGIKNGFKGKTGIYQTVRGARLGYTPLGETFNDMDFEVVVCPGKTAAQGFGSDYQYMDLMIKYDLNTETGFGIRVYRKSGSSCEFVLMEHRNGKSKEITTPVESSAYLSDCTIHVWTTGNTLNATVNSTGVQPPTSALNNLPHSVTLKATITNNSFGGFCIQHTGTVGDNVTYITSLGVVWK